MVWYGTVVDGGGMIMRLPRGNPLDPFTAVVA